MRTLSSAVNTMLSLYNTETFFLVELEGLSRYHTTLPYDITMGNNITYTSDGGLIGVDPPRLSSVIDREAYKIRFSDLAFEFRDSFNAGIVGEKIKVYLGFFNSSEQTINSVPPSKIFTNMSDTILIYEGVIDSHAYDINISNSESICLIEGSSPMAHLDLVKVFHSTKQQMREYSTTDSALDFSYQGSGEISLKWGKL